MALSAPLRHSNLYHHLQQHPLNTMRSNGRRAKGKQKGNLVGNRIKLKFFVTKCLKNLLNGKWDEAMKRKKYVKHRITEYIYHREERIDKDNKYVEGKEESNE